MTKAALKAADDPTILMGIVDRLPSEFRELVYKHYMQERGVVEKLEHLLDMTPEERKAEFKKKAMVSYFSSKDYGGRACSLRG
jgi:hypothetical protein